MLQKFIKIMFNSEQVETQNRRNTKNMFSKRIGRKYTDFYKPVFNKIMTPQEQCVKYSFVAPLKPCNSQAATLSKPALACWALGFNAFRICHNVLSDFGLKLNDLQYLLYSFIV